MCLTPQNINSKGAFLLYRNQQNIPLALLQTLRSGQQKSTFLFYLKLRIYTRHKHGFFKLDNDLYTFVGLTRRTCLKQLEIGLKTGMFVADTTPNHFHITSIYKLTISRCQWETIYRRTTCCVVSDELVLNSSARNMALLKFHFEEAITDFSLNQIHRANRKSLYNKEGSRKNRSQQSTTVNAINGSVKYGACKLVGKFNHLSEATILKRRKKVADYNTAVNYQYEPFQVEKCPALIGFDMATTFNEALRNKDERLFNDRLLNKVKKNHFWGLFYYSSLTGYVVYSPPSVRESSIKLIRCHIPFTAKKQCVCNA